MTDIENIVFSRISAAIRAAFPNNFTTSTNGIITGEKVSAPSSFPAVSISEETNSVYRRTQDSDSVENHSSLMYEVEIYSNRSSGRKAECKAIAKVIDDEMAKLNFTRTMLQPIPNATPNITRYFGRYVAVVSRDGWVYRK
jgi:hypothetical protein